MITKVGDIVKILLKPVKSEEDIKKYGNYKVELVKYHQQYANKIGLFDKVVDSYDYNRAIRHIGENNFFQFFIQIENEKVGILEYQITISDIDKKEILYLKNLYIFEQFRGKGIGKEIINILKKLNYRIELECWYGIPAKKLYQSLGMKEIKIRYMIE